MTSKAMQIFLSAFHSMTMRELTWPKRARVSRKPHQGKQEIARRRRQIAAGMLRVTG